jgi:hypothetical protein
MIDILLNQADDLLITDGDFVLGDAENQNQELLLLVEKGGLKQFPTDTTGVGTYLEDEDIEGLIREGRRCFIGDGLDVERFTVENGKLIISAEY